MDNKGCYACEHVKLGADEEPCLSCKYTGNAEGKRDNYKARKKITNGDRIRRMSDEELTMIIMCPYDTAGEPSDIMPCIKDGNILICSMAPEKCKECCLDWLKRKAKTETAAGKDKE